MDKLYSISEIENAVIHHRRIIETMGNPIPDAIKDAVGMFQQLADIMRENERLKEDVAMFARIAEDWKNWCFEKGFEGLDQRNKDSV